MDVKPLSMIRGEQAALEPFESLLVKQTPKATCDCQEKTEFRIATMQNPQQDIMYAIEESSCCLRTFCCGIHPYTMSLSAGGTPGGAPIATYKRHMCCPIRRYKCCCYQKTIVLTPGGQNLGSIKETCWYCVPSFAIFRADGTHEFDLHRPTCCGGMCVDYCAETYGSFPLYLFPPGSSGKKEEKVGRMSWDDASYKEEHAMNFEVTFPVNIDADAKARLFDLHQPTCSYGMCVDCCVEGFGPGTPFYLFPPGSSGMKGEQVGSIVKGLTGRPKELFADTLTFEVKFPVNVDADSKALLIGGAFLLINYVMHRMRIR